MHPSVGDVAPDLLGNSPSGHAEFKQVVAPDPRD